MKVQGPGNRGVGQVHEPRDAGQPKANEQTTKAKAPEEKIQVSSLSKLLSDAKVSAGEVKDPDKIAQLKSALESGNFKVDTERTAEAMLREES
ncbi:MAG TPA: flagellar biosynthesis anti-sigma factor FlgM [Polyangiales bacterium]|nr:flagellar biosynthesis anti-sigma factor FlgM [Polyangiales bacterium]